MSMLSALMNKLRGQGDAAVTVPVLDGPLMPNRVLDDRSELVLRAEGVDNLVGAGGDLIFSQGTELHRLAPGGGTRVVRRCEADITAMAVHEDAAALGLDDRGLMIEGGRHHGLLIGDLSRWGLRGGVLPCITAIAWLDADTLVVANAASSRRVSEWRRDLLERGRSGSIVRIDLKAKKAVVLADRLAWPWGIAPSNDGGLFVSEAWRHRILSLPASFAGAAPEVVQSDMPAYPARIAPATGGGYWLSFVSIRNQLVEFILREPEYRRRMLDEVPEPYWMAPSLASGLSFKEPMQQNQLRQMGIMKPWAPTRSYGLVVRCDDRMRPIESFHSRADGRIHGVTAACDLHGDLFVCAKGASAIVCVPGVAN